ncbi:winged helix DNA-binding domain-containing protein [Athelia psychrophila]|uniref:Winged helix DNA-binding domain-containing protein n=1 Tax=Athelia psychrophila TaxID=1759441 RepID=A0A166G7E3_9AGAM|nr:winged helix DNA-binding domain-containing protein [Fibularhizoctonia sp. CBS 109695]
MRLAGVAISGFLLPPIHSMPHFFTQQPNRGTLSTQTEQWTRLILAYARHRKLFMFRAEDAVATTGEWGAVLLNERINRRVLPAHLAYIFADMVAKNVAGYEPPKQTRSILLYWRLPEEWAEVLHGWITSTTQLKKILTFYEITNPPIESPLTDLPLTLLRQAIAILGKTGRAQTITVPDGEGARFFAGSWRP